MTETLKGPLRAPAQMLQEQSYGGHKSLHDDSEAERLGIKAGPIEGPTHFSQFVPYLAEIWGDAWFERGCFSSHFLNMVFEGEKVRVEVDRPAAGETRTMCRAFKEDGTPVLEASASIGPDHGETLLEARMAKLRPAGDLVILADLHVGMTGAADEVVTMGPDQHMGNLYPFSLADKLKVITEPMDVYSDGSAGKWGKPIVPLEMISVLGNYSNRNSAFGVKQPAIGSRGAVGKPPGRELLGPHAFLRCRGRKAGRRNAAESWRDESELSALSCRPVAGLRRIA